jgi:serpin B
MRSAEIRHAALAAVVAFAAGCAASKPVGNIPPLTTARPDETSAGAPSASNAIASDASAPVASGAAPASSGGLAHAGADAEDVRAANTFAWKLYERARKAAPGNVMLSGPSLRTALAIPYLGAKGATATEMASALGLPSDPARAADLAKREAAEWQRARGKAELFVASRLFTDEAHAPSAEYTRAVEGAFGASPEALDFTKPEDARKTINAWVAGHTKDKIPELLAKGAVDARSRLVVANAIYFKARWSAPFVAGSTKDEPFHVDPKKSVTVPMMHATEQHRLAEADGAKVLELPYAESELQMLLVLPDDPAGLGKLEGALGDDKIEKWSSALAAKRVAVSLPRFTFRSGGSMNAALRDLGIKTAFGDAADFSGISPAKGIALSQVAHQTWIAVDEQGTEAAAATGIVMHATSLVIGPVVEFKADHPFVFVIRDGKSHRTLFVGRVADPSAH